jgi:hypothetical protein
MINSSYMEPLGRGFKYELRKGEAGNRCYGNLAYDRLTGFVNGLI